MGVTIRHIPRLHHIIVDFPGNRDAESRSARQGIRFEILIAQDLCRLRLIIKLTGGSMLQYKIQQITF